MTVAAILKVKGSHVETTRPETTLYTVAWDLKSKNIGALVVVGEDSASILGMISERDLVRALIEHGTHLLALPVSKMMTTPVPTCTPHDRVTAVMARMTRYRVRHLAGGRWRQARRHCEHRGRGQVPTRRARAGGEHPARDLDGQSLKLGGGWGMASDVNARFLVVVAFLIERDHHVLLLRRSMSKDHAPGEWEPGSGRVRQGEAPLAAVRREVKEETGLDVTVLGPLDTFHFYRGTAREEAIGITFHCRATGGDLTLSSEHVEGKWVPFEQLRALDCPDWMQRAFAALLLRGNQAAGRSA